MPTTRRPSLSAGGATVVVVVATGVVVAVSPPLEQAAAPSPAARATANRRRAWVTTMQRRRGGSPEVGRGHQTGTIYALDIDATDDALEVEVSTTTCPLRSVVIGLAVDILT